MLGDIFGDGDHRGIIADFKQNEIKIFKGTSIEHTKKLSGSPIGIQLFYPIPQKIRKKMPLIFSLSFSSDRVRTSRFHVQKDGASIHLPDSSDLSIPRRTYNIQT